MEFENLKWWQIILLGMSVVLLIVIGFTLDMLAWYVRISFLKWMFS